MTVFDEETTENENKPGRGQIIAECCTSLTGAQRRALRALGHPLRATVMIGHHGLTPSLAAALDVELVNHELVKIKVQDGAPDDMGTIARWIVSKTGASVPQLLGKTLLAYRAHPEEPRIRLPDAGR